MKNVNACFYRFKETVATGIANLIVYTQQRGFKNDEWIGAIPLYHFLMGYVLPFDPPEVIPEKITLDDLDKELQLNKVQRMAEPGLVVRPILNFLALNRRCWASLRCITQCLDKFQALTEADPLLLRGLVYMCPTAEYSVIFNKIPPLLSATLLSRQSIGEIISTHKVK